MKTILLLTIFIAAAAAFPRSPDLLLVHDFSPLAAVTTPPGNAVVFGEGFGPTCAVYFDGLVARETVFPSSNRLEAIIPYLRPGEHRVRVKCASQVAEAATPFTSLPSPVDSQIDKALAQERLGQISEALDILSAIAEDNPDLQVRSFAHYLKGQLYFARGDWLRWYGESSEIYLNANLAGPSIQTYWPYGLAYSLAHYLLNVGVNQGGDVSLLNDVVSSDVTRAPEPRFARGLLLARIGKLAEAQKDADYCLKMDPENPAYLALAGFVAASSGNKAQYADFVRRARASLPGKGANPQALSLVGEAEYVAGEVVKARADWTEMGRVYPTWSSIALSLGKKHRGIGSPAAASALLSEVGALSPNSPESEEADKLLEGFRASH